MPNDKSMRPVPSPVVQAVILVCEKCGRKLANRDSDNPAYDLQQEIKSSGKELLGRKQIRAVMTSCLDVCPKGLIAVAVAMIDHRTEFYEVDPENQRRAVAALVAELAISSEEAQSHS